MERIAFENNGMYITQFSHIFQHRILVGIHVKITLYEHSLTEMLNSVFITEQKAFVSNKN